MTGMCHNLHNHFVTSFLTWLSLCLCPLRHTNNNNNINNHTISTVKKGQPAFHRTLPLWEQNKYIVIINNYISTTRRHIPQHCPRTAAYTESVASWHWPDAWPPPSEQGQTPANRWSRSSSDPPAVTEFKTSCRTGPCNTRHNKLNKSPTHKPHRMWAARTSTIDKSQHKSDHFATHTVHSLSNYTVHSLNNYTVH